MSNLVCGYCSRAFYKPEHLKRHERSHTGSRPFSCTTCGRAFSRQDSLLRHERLHTKPRTCPYASPSPTVDTHTSSPSEIVRSTATSVSGLSVVTESHFRDGEDPEARHHSVQTFGQGEVDTISNTLIPSSDLDLIWPDSEDLFQALLTSENSSQWQLPFGPASLPTPTNSTTSPAAPSTRFGDQPPSIDNIPIGANNRAVDEVSAMINAQSHHITAAVQSCRIDSLFLDQCLHMFFIRFNPTFPILHRPTFVFRECLHPFLLNAIAIGSLYLGHKDAAAKGEVLWRLAHTALANLWQTMIAHQGPYDDRPGVQLLLASLLGQIYGVLSRNRTIRTTSQAFHLLSFFWARQCGLLDAKSESVLQAPEFDADQEEKTEFWRTWVSREIQHRALLAHFALDGLIARMCGSSTSEQHMLARQTLPSSETLFMANSADEFLLHYRDQDTPQRTFRAAFEQLRTPNMPATNIHTAFSLAVLTEALQTKICEMREDDLPDAQQNLDETLDRLRGIIISCPSLSNPERGEAMLRWHAICLESIVNTSALCRFVCYLHNIDQKVWSTPTPSSAVVELPSWAHSNEGRRALLHAVAIQEIVEELPRGRAHTTHMPAALFAAATICAVFCLSGVTTINLPNTIDWHEVQTTTCGSQISSSNNETKTFICGKIDTSTVVFGTFRNLPYEFNSMQKLFGCLTTQWGIAQDMDAVVREWSRLFH